MNKLIFSILICVLAISASAFTNVEKAKRFVVTYYHHADGTYTTLQLGPCVSAPTTACRITYPSSQGSSFPDTLIPAGGILSGDAGYQ